MKLDDLIFTSILAIISFIAGIIGLINRAEHKTKERLKDKLLFIGFGGVSSILIGFIAYEISFYSFDNQRLCLAISAYWGIFFRIASIPNAAPIQVIVAPTTGFI